MRNLETLQHVLLQRFYQRCNNRKCKGADHKEYKQYNCTKPCNSKFHRCDLQHSVCRLNKQRMYQVYSKAEPINLPKCPTLLQLHICKNVECCRRHERNYRRVISYPFILKYRIQICNNSYCYSTDNQKPILAPVDQAFKILTIIPKYQVEYWPCYRYGKCSFISCSLEQCCYKIKAKQDY